MFLGCFSGEILWTWFSFSTTSYFNLKWTLVIFKHSLNVFPVFSLLLIKKTFKFLAKTVWDQQVWPGKSNIKKEIKIEKDLNKYLVRMTWKFNLFNGKLIFSQFILNMDLLSTLILSENLDFHFKGLIFKYKYYI